jgi:hypothetical protein
MMPTRLCNEPGCPNPATARGKCREHASRARKANRSPNDAFYSSKAWHITRRRQLFEHPLCQYPLDSDTECGEVADSVHHNTPIEDGGARRDPANLMSVCRPHHTAIHRAMAEGRVA